MKVRTITQRELRNESGAVLREVEAGRTVIVNRNGTPIAELRPIERRRFVPRATIADAASSLRASMPSSSVRIWMQSLIPTLMSEPGRGVLDTSVLIDHDLILAELDSQAARASRICS